jgi:hypothetical protein
VGFGGYWGLVGGVVGFVLFLGGGVLGLGGHSG